MDDPHENEPLGEKQKRKNKRPFVSSLECKLSSIRNETNTRVIFCVWYNEYMMRNRKSAEGLREIAFRCSMLMRRGMVCMCVGLFAISILAFKLGIAGLTYTGEEFNITSAVGSEMSLDLQPEWRADVAVSSVLAVAKNEEKQMWGEVLAEARKAQNMMSEGSLGEVRVVYEQEYNSGIRKYEFQAVLQADVSNRAPGTKYVARIIIKTVEDIEEEKR
jgi:hypothetical protein